MTASAHFFGTSYTLPIPFWMYAYGAAAALVVSFALIGYFVNADSMEVNFHSRTLGGGRLLMGIGSPRVIGTVRALTVLGLLVTIATGLFGNPSPYDNFSMTFFWVAFVLGFTYLSALIGDLYAVLNPWSALCQWLAHLAPQVFSHSSRYPRRLGYWPALLLYLLFIWVELFAHAGPHSLALLLLAYFLVTVIGAALFGLRTWIRFGEFFAVFFRLVGKMAPFEYVRSPDGRPQLRVRRPFIGLVTDSAEDSSLVVFVLAMLSTTAFDGAHETLPWVGLFWKGIYPILEPMVSALSQEPYVVASDLFYYWQWLMLALSPFIYYCVYLFFILLTKAITRSHLSVRELSIGFAFTLIPIAFVYNVTHYYTLLITQAPNLITLISDPFGNGWNLFGTRDIVIPPIIPAAGFVWHSQVWLILAGHIVSVYLAHLRALQLFPSSRIATLSQIPMLLLMVILTSVGLWILSLPIGST